MSSLLQEEMVKAGRNELKAETLALHRSSSNKYHKAACSNLATGNGHCSQWRQFLLFWPLVTCDAAQF